MNCRLVFLILPLLLFSCSNLLDQFADDQVYSQSLEIPPDQATARERNLIDNVLLQIEAESKALGSPRSFHELPVIVLDENIYTTHRWGYCQYKSDMSGLYIAINREVFSYSKNQKNRGLMTNLYQTILHEIGHCYFGRAHEEGQIFIGEELITSWTAQNGKRYYRNFSTFPKSIMHPVAGDEIPDALNNYYVGEVLGNFRAQSFKDLKRYLKFE